MVERKLEKTMTEMNDKMNKEIEKVYEVAIFVLLSVSEAKHQFAKRSY